MSKVFSGKLKVVKVNVDRNKAVAGKFNIRSIPTIVLFKNGKVAWRRVGLLTKKELITHLNNSIN